MGEGETPKTGLVGALCAAETVFGVSGCFWYSPPKGQNGEWVTRKKTWGQLHCAPIKIFAPAFSPLIAARANVKHLYRTQRMGEGETPKTGLVGALCAAETVFGVSGCFGTPGQKVKTENG